MLCDEIIYKILEFDNNILCVCAMPKHYGIYKYIVDVNNLSEFLIGPIFPNLKKLIINDMNEKQLKQIFEKYKNIKIKCIVLTDSTINEISATTKNLILYDCNIDSIDTSKIKLKHLSLNNSIVKNLELDKLDSLEIYNSKIMNINMNMNKAVVKSLMLYFLKFYFPVNKIIGLEKLIIIDDQNITKIDHIPSLDYIFLKNTIIKSIDKSNKLDYLYSEFNEYLEEIPELGNIKVIELKKLN
jgi:hypothetical protein